MKNHNWTESKPEPHVYITQTEPKPNLFKKYSKPEWTQTLVFFPISSFKYSWKKKEAAA